MFYLTLYRRACHLDRVHSSQAKARLADCSTKLLLSSLVMIQTLSALRWSAFFFFQEREIWGCKGQGRTAGSEHRENRGWVGYGKRKEGFLKEWEAGEIDRELCKNAKSHYGSWKCLIFRNRKRAKARKLRNKGREMKKQGVGSGRLGPPFPLLTEGMFIC